MTKALALLLFAVASLAVAAVVLAAAAAAVDCAGDFGVVEHRSQRGLHEQDARAIHRHPGVDVKLLLLLLLLLLAVASRRCRVQLMPLPAQNRSPALQQRLAGGLLVAMRRRRDL